MMLSYRSTPLRCGFSPAELLMARTLQTTVPTTRASLKPAMPAQNRLRESEERYKRQQQSNYDHHHGVRSLVPLAPGQRVWVPDRSEEAHVVQEAGTRSYEVQTSQGLYRQNRRALIDLPSSDRTEQSNLDSPDSEILPVSPPTEDTHPTNQPDPPVRRSSRVSRPPDRLDPSF